VAQRRGRVGESRRLYMSNANLSLGETKGQPLKAARRDKRILIWTKYPVLSSDASKGVNNNCAGGTGDIKVEQKKVYLVSTKKKKRALCGDSTGTATKSPTSERA